MRRLGFRVKLGGLGGCTGFGVQGGLEGSSRRGGKVRVDGLGAFVLSRGNYFLGVLVFRGFGVRV